MKVLRKRKEKINQKMFKIFDFVKTPTTTSIQINTISTVVGFDTIMTVHHHIISGSSRYNLWIFHQELYPSSGEAAE